MSRFQPPPEHAQRNEVFHIAIDAETRLVIRLGYYGPRLLCDFMAQLESLVITAWHPVARVDCCGGVVHRHQYVRSTGEDVLDHLPWAEIPTGSRRETDALLGEAYDWAYGLLYSERDDLVRRWRNG